MTAFVAGALAAFALQIVAPATFNTIALKLRALALKVVGR